jgi:prevent-host-death family protein
MERLRMVVNIHESKSHFSPLVERVRRGEEMVMGKAGKPVARLVPYRENDTRRVSGGWEGRVRSAEYFDELPAEVAAVFRGERP